MATSPNTIISYPDANTPLDGTESYAAWQNGGQRQITGLQLSQFLLNGIGTPSDESAVAAALSQQLSALSASQSAIGAAIQSILGTPVTAGGTLPFEVASITGGGGTGGAPGTYTGITSGGPAGFQWQVFVGSDGKAVPQIVNPGISTSNAAPTLTMPTITGLTGTTTPTATVGTIPVNRVFYASSSDGTQLLAWGNNAGVLASSPFGGTQLVQSANVSSLLGGSNIAPAGLAASGSTFSGDGSVYWWPTILATSPQWLDSLTFAMASAGAVTIVVATVGASNTLTFVSKASYGLAAGVSTLSGLGISVPAGAIVGVQLIGGSAYYTNGAFGGTAWKTPGIPTTGTATTSTSIVGVHWGCALIGEVIFKSRYAFATGLANGSALGATYTLGALAPTGTGTTATTPYTVASANPAPAAGFVTGFNVAVNAATTVNLLILSISASNVATIVSSTPFQVSAGANTVTGLSVPIAAGQYIAISGSGLIYNAADGTVLYFEGKAIATGDTLTGPSSTYRFEVNWTLSTAVVGQTSVNSAQVANLASMTGGSIKQGSFPAAVGTGTATGGFTWVNPIPFSAAGVLSAVSIYAAAGGAATLIVGTVSGTTFTPIASQAVTLSPGQNTITNFNPTVAVGEVLALYSAIGTIEYVVGGTCYKYTGLASGPGAIGTVNVTLQMGWQIDSGLFRRVASLELSGGATSAGLGLLSAADPSGVVDATSLFTSARSQHPTPNVPQGTFAVTALPYFGEGFWGTGTVVVNGVTISLPPRPEQGSRYLKLRAALVSQIYSGSALIINGDSISNGLAASSSKTTWVSLLTRFANMGIALDDAVLVDFDNSDASSVGGLSFHGVTMANPTTVTNGTAGPVSKSLMLQAGQSLSVTGAYERIDATYTGVSGGALVFAYNGTTYKTVTCATTGSDVLASAGATGQTASGTYTITNSGSVAVEITSLMRFGVKVANSPPRLYVCRFAHGGYAFTNYGAAQIASMVRIATAIAGGTNHFLVPALGTNDEAGAALSYAALKTNVTTYLNNWVSAGIPIANMLPAMPWRWSSYASGGSYEQGNAAIRDAYRAGGIRRVIQTDGYDFIAQGFSSGDGHPNDAGMMAEFNAAVAGLSESTL